MRGVTVRLRVQRPPALAQKFQQKPDTYLIDMTPRSARGDADFLESAPLPGRTFRDPVPGITITDVAVGAGRATVTVSRP